MNDEDTKIKQNDTDSNAREIIANQLDSFINQTNNQNNADVASYYSKLEKEPDPLIKIPDIPTQETQKQTRPIIRTYKSDVEEMVQTNHISSINIALAENKKIAVQTQQVDVENKKILINKSILILSVILIIGGAAAFFVPKFLVSMQNKKPEQPIETVDSKPVMTADSQEKLNIKDININRVNTTLKERVDQSATSLGQIKNIFLTEGTGTEEKLITSKKFLSLIGATVPDEIQRTLKDQYMFGLHNYSGIQKFLVLKVGSFDTTFSGMLNWETNMWSDFKELFNLPSDNTNPNDLLGMQIKKFQDATFNNKDCRVVKDSSGNIIFLYSIIDDNTIVITTLPDTLKEIMERTSKARVVTQ